MITSMSGCDSFTRCSMQPDVRHHDVEQHDVVAAFLDTLQRLGAARRGVHDALAVAEGAPAALQHDLLVVDDQNPRAHALTFACTGSSGR
jgi:hypothetical protein